MTQRGAQEFLPAARSTFLDGLESVALVDAADWVVAEARGLPTRQCAVAEVSAADDVVIVCGSRPGEGVRELARRLDTAMPKTLAIASRTDEQDMMLALTHGAGGYFTESEWIPFPGADLPGVVAAVAAGASCLGSAATSVLATVVRGTVPRAAGGGRQTGRDLVAAALLTPRERQVMDLISTGLSTAETAAAMSIQVRTVRNNLANIYPKLGVHLRSEAVLVWLGHLPAAEPRPC